MENEEEVIHYVEQKLLEALESLESIESIEASGMDIEDDMRNKKEMI